MNVFRKRRQNAYFSHFLIKRRDSEMILSENELTVKSILLVLQFNGRHICAPKRDKNMAEYCNFLKIIFVIRL